MSRPSVPGRRQRLRAICVHAACAAYVVYLVCCRAPQILNPVGADLIGMFDEIVKNAECVLRRSAGEEKRRQAWLAPDEDEERAGAVAGDNAAVASPGSRADTFGCDLNRFVPLGGPKPPYWKEAVKIAGWIQVDEMRPMHAQALWQTVLFCHAAMR